MTIVTPQQATQTQSSVQGLSESVDPAIATKTDSAPDEMISPKYAALARQQKVIRKQQMELKAREDALKAKESEYTTNYVPKSKLKSDPLSVLLEQGFTQEDILNALTQQNDPQAQLAKKVDEKFSSIEERLKKADEDSKAKQKAAYDQAVSQIRNEAKKLVESDPNLEGIKAYDAVEDVVNLIEETFSKGDEAKGRPIGHLLSVEEAANEIEEQIFEQAMKMAQLQKVQKKLQPPAPVAAPVKPTGLSVQLKQQTPAKTLTNANTTVPSKPFSQKERMERAKLAFLGKLET